MVAASGVGFDLEDRYSEQLEGDDRYFVQRFGGSVREDGRDPSTTAWRREASVLRSLDSGDPPVLSLLAAMDYPSVHRQMRIADERLRALGLSGGFVIVPDADHLRMVLELSRADHVTGRAILKFLRETPCPRK